LDALAVGADVINLPRLAAGVEAAIGMGRDALGVVESFAEDAGAFQGERHDACPDSETDSASPARDRPALFGGDRKPLRPLWVAVVRVAAELLVQLGVLSELLAIEL